MRRCFAAAVTAVVVAGWFFVLSSVACAEKYEVRKIWNAAPHNAFTDLIRWQGRFYCVFRESTAHVAKNHAGDGKIRVLVSDDGKEWTSFGLLAKDKVDLRDAKLSIMPDGRLMVLMGGSFYTYKIKKEMPKRVTQVAFMSDPAKGFGPIVPTEIDKKIRTDLDWLWRVTWKEGVGYGVVYQADKEKDTWKSHLVKTTDGIHYDLVKTLDLPGRVGETTVRFASEGEMFLFARCETGEDHGYLARAKAPYTDWSWKTIDMRLGGPNAIQLSDGTWLLATRYHGPKKITRTVLAKLDDNGHAERIIELPSGSDTSYPGLVLHDGKLWVSYYSSHEGKASIYLATVPLAELP